VSHEPPEFPACAVCGRTILRGERAFEYRTGDGSEAMVCALCRDAAEARGWLPAAAAPAGTPDEAAPPRRRALRGRLERAAERLQAGAAERLHAGRTARAEPPPPEPRRLDEGPRTPERLIRTALEYFNATDQPRKVAGLARSLGPPRVHAEADLDAGRVEVVVAWELTWYRWEVGPDGQVEQTGRGAELDELEAGEREWNAAAGESGALRLEAAAEEGEKE
jgi:hypothetical protein